MAKFEELRYVIKVDDQGTFTIDELNVKTNRVKDTFKALSKELLSTDAVKKKLNATDRVSIKELRELRDTLIKNRDAMTLTAKEYSNFTSQIDKVNVRINEFKTQAKGLTKVNGDMQSSAGLAGAATIELGRVFSDAGFGIRGVANNIQQLASLFITLSVSAGGAGKAITLIARQLRGPLGILVLFQGLVSLIEFLDRKYKIFSSTVDEATKAIEKQRDALSAAKGNVAVLRAYADVLEDSTASVDAQAIALQRLKKEGYDPTIGSIEQFIEAQGKLLILKATEEIVADDLKRLIKEQDVLNDRLKAANDEVEEIRKKFTPEELEDETPEIFVGATGIVQTKRTPKDILDEALEEVRAIEDEEFLINLDINVALKKVRDKIKELSDGNPFFASLFGGVLKGKKLDEPIDPIALQYQIDLLLNKGIVDPELKDFLGLFDEVIKAQEKINKTSEAVGKVRVVDMDDVAFAEYVDFLSQFPDVAGKTQEQLFEIEKQGALDRLDEIYDFRGEETENNILYQEDRLKIEEFYNGKIESARKKHFDKIRKDVKESSKFIQSIIQDSLELRRATTERELALVDSKTNQLLNKEGVTESERIKIIQDSEKKKQKINEESIKAEMKLTQLKFAIKAAELAANIAADFAEGVVSLKVGAANTAKNGFPQNIPLLLSYAAQAAAIITGMVGAKRQAETALASLGGGSIRTATPTTEQIVAPEFNVVGQSQASQLSESISGALGEPVKAYVVSTEIADSLAFQRQIDRQSGFGS